MCRRASRNHEPLDETNGVYVPYNWQTDLIRVRHGERDQVRQVLPLEFLEEVKEYVDAHPRVKYPSLVEESSDDEDGYGEDDGEPAPSEKQVVETEDKAEDEAPKGNGSPCTYIVKMRVGCPHTSAENPQRQYIFQARKIMSTLKDME